MSEDTKGKVLELPEDLDEVEIRVINEEEESSESDEKFLFDEFPRDEEETFQSWDEVENLEGLERGGVWMDHPKVAGTKIMIARSDDAERESKRLERIYRSKNKVDDDDKLDSKAYLRIIGLSMYGRAIKDWEMPPDKDGRRLEFNKANFMAKWKLLRFAMPILQEVAAVNKGESDWIEKALGNSQSG
jgi:hypothetical protein